MINNSEGELIQMIDKRVGLHESRLERLALEESWISNVAFWSGKQRFFFEQGRLYDAALDNPDEAVQYKVNLVRSRVLAACAKVLAVNAKFRVRPPTGTSRDRELAQLSEKVFDHIREVTDFEWHLMMATMWKAVCGSSFLKIQWDPMKGDPDRFYLSDPQSRRVIPEQMLTPAMKAEKDQSNLFEDYAPGDISVSVLSPFAAFQDTSSRDSQMAGCQWFAEKHYVDIDRIAERFGMDPKDIQPMEADAGLRNYEEAIAFMSNGSGLSLVDWAQPEDKRGKRTQYVELWQRPSKQYPKGMRVVYAGGRILNLNRAGGLDNPYAADRTGWAHIPYVKDDWCPHPGRFWGASLVEDLIGPQYYLNASRTVMMQFMETFGLPNTYVGDQAGIDTDNMPVGGGRIYQVNEVSSFKVQHGPPPQIPPDVARFMDVCEADLNKAAAQSEINADGLPGQLRSGSAVRAINEERFITLTVPGKSTLRTVRDAGKIALALGKMYYGEKRLMRYLGEDNEWVVEEFNGADLRNDFVIVGNPSVADTVASGREEMLDALQAGAFNPQFDEQTRALILKGLHYNTSDEFIKRTLQAERNQEREIQEMIKDPLKYGDEGYPVMEWEDHAKESAVIIAYMYTPEFKRLPVQTQALITDHWKKHQMFIQQAQMQAMQMAEAMKGIPGQKGQASQPTF